MKKRWRRIGKVKNPHSCVGSTAPFWRAQAPLLTGRHSGHRPSMDTPAWRFQAHISISLFGGNGALFGRKCNLVVVYIFNTEIYSHHAGGFSCAVEREWSQCFEWDPCSFRRPAARWVSPFPSSLGGLRTVHRVFLRIEKLR